MSRHKTFIFLASTVSVTMLCFLFLMLFGSCSSESTNVGPEEDAAVEVDSEPDSEPPEDFYVPPEDIKKPPVDQYVWPDTAPPKDAWPPPTDSYAATPFGCNTDADCFGRKCCATPWGVKLCAIECN